MKIQLKRSNVLENSAAKAPTASQMEYGEIAINYNAADPAIFIKDSTNQVIRVTNLEEIGDGQINIDPGVGITASGSNAKANQTGNTTRVLGVNTTWLTDYINGWGTTNVFNGQINVNAGDGLTASGSNGKANQSTNTTRILGIDTTWLTNFINTWAGNGGVPTPPVVNDGQINVSAGTGLSASGSNATANQSANTTRTLEIDTTWLDNYIGTPETVGDGQINISAGNGLVATGDNATANQTGNTTRTLAAVSDTGYAIDVTASGIRLGNNWGSLPTLPTTTTLSTPTPQAMDGYYPLYTSESDANAAGNGTSHSHTFNGVTYYMPNGVTYYHGNYSS